MEAIIKFKPSELDEVLRRIKYLIANDAGIELAISIKDLPGKADYWAKLQQSMEEERDGENAVLFTVQEFENYYQSKLTQ